MEIIQQGNLSKVPGHRKYKGTCPKCGCVFKFEDSDKECCIKDGEWVHCPTCGESITIPSKHVEQCDDQDPKPDTLGNVRLLVPHNVLNNDILPPCLIFPSDMSECKKASDLMVGDECYAIDDSKAIHILKIVKIEKRNALIYLEFHNKWYLLTPTDNSSIQYKTGDMEEPGIVYFSKEFVLGVLEYEQWKLQKDIDFFKKM